MPTSSASDSDSDSSSTNIPVPPTLHLQRPFGSGLHRKPITFIRASPSTTTTTTTTANNNNNNNTTETAQPRKKKSAAEQYLDIISTAPPRLVSAAVESPVAEKEDFVGEAEETEGKEICRVCRLPLSTGITDINTTTNAANATATAPHESLLAHQVCLAHVHPPSALDRRRMGVRYLVSCGWDPDSREGLGRRGEGRRVPVKAVEKRDTLGLGVVKPAVVVLDKVIKKKVGAKEARLLAAREKRRDEQLRELVLGRGKEVERILRGG